MSGRPQRQTGALLAVSGATTLLGLACGALVLALALWVRLEWLPVGQRHVFDGHEAEYLDLFLGRSTPSWSTRMVPPLGLLYQGLGALSHDPRLLIATSALAGLTSIAAIMDMVRRQVGVAGALLTGLLLALYGNHAFWCSSAYPVIMPFALLVSGLWLLSARRVAAWLPASFCLSLAIGMRPELALSLPATFFWRGQRWGGWWLLWVLATSAMAAVITWPLLQPGAHPSGLWQTAPLALAANLRSLDYLAPWSSTATLALGVLLGLAAAIRWRRAATGWAALAVSTYLPACAFADSGFRHALTAGAALCVLSALGLVALATPTGPRGPRHHGSRALAALLGLLCLVLLISDTSRLAARYYAPAAAIHAELAALAPTVYDDSGFAGCRWITEEPPLPDQELPSHLTLHRFDGCLLWGEEFWHRSWTSRGLLDRGLRMHALYRMEPLALRVWREDPGRPARLVWRLTGRRAAWPWTGATSTGAAAEGG